MNNLKKLLHIFQSSALKQVLRWADCVKGRLAATCLFAVLGILFSLGTTVVTRELIDSAVSSQQEALWRCGLALALLMLAERAVRVGGAAIRVTMSARLQKHLQGGLMNELLLREYAGLKKYHSGELVSRVFSDVSVVKNGIVGMLPNLCSMLVSFIGAAVILWTMDARLVIVLLLFSLVGAGVMLLFREPMKQRHTRMQQAESRLHASIQETLENIRTVKASLSEERIMRRVYADQDTLEKEQRRQGFFSLGMNQTMGMMFSLSWLVCMLWGCYNIFRGNMTYGALAAMIQLIGRIQGPIASAADIAGQAYGVVASAERLQELLSIPREEQTEQPEDFDVLRVDHVSFIYEDGNEEVLRDVDCEIRKGDFVALTGISGGGKTSLFQLLLGIYQPVSGRILFECNGHSIPASRGTRGLFAYVPQGNTLISGTLRENLRLFCNDATDEQLLRAARAACIEPLVEELGLDAVLGERGIGLSEGQAQRVAVARALLSDAPILLLDEATSALDDETEAQLLKNIAAMKEKTCIIVTHRSAALAICNRRFHISAGGLTIPEEG